MPRSREELQKLTQTSSEMLRLLDLIWSDIKTPKASSASIHVVNLDEPTMFQTHVTPEFRSTLISLLKSEYPGCHVRYHETQGFNGKVLERLVIMDWSVMAGA